MYLWFVCARKEPARFTASFAHDVFFLVFTSFDMDAYSNFSQNHGLEKTFPMQFGLSVMSLTPILKQKGRKEDRRSQINTVAL